MTGTGFSTSKLSLIGFLVVLILAWFCYRPAISGVFQLDDVSNLAALTSIEDSSSTIDFVLSGTAGPVGRPLALLSFVFQAEEWEQGAAAFIQVNILIHLLNALILAGCLYQLSLLQAVEQKKAVIVAVAAASMWVIMPLLASASLLVVQRMTTLSAFFVLLGLSGYLVSRSRFEASPNRALIGMSLSIAVGTLLATLAKESGLLLPTYVLVLEATLLKRPSGIANRIWRLWQIIFLLVPTLVIVTYLMTRVAYPEWTVLMRGFTGWERLLTEARLLWLYLYKALLGFPGQLGIFQTPPTISRSIFEPLAFLAVLSWSALGIASIVWRRRYPLFSLAVLWYLTGHVIESSVVPLELYFEHRNYLPILGPLYALCAYLLLNSPQLRRVAYVVVPLYVLSGAFFLHGFASLSGEPSSASRYWALKYPDSVRAVTTMATYQLSEEGPIRTLSTIDRFVTERPQFAYLRIQELNLRCMYMSQENHEAVLVELRRELPNVDFTYTAGTMLSQFLSTVISVNCNGIGPDTVAELADILRQNPRYIQGPLYNQFHHKLMAGIARQKGDYDATIDHLERAIARRGTNELNMMMVTALGGAGDFDGANEFIDAALQRQPGHPLRAVAWRSNLEKLREYINELERYSQSVE